MSATARRTIFYTRVNGNIAFHDWCLVQTGLGAMMEPLVLNRFNADGQAYNPADECTLVSELKEMDLNALQGMPPFSDVDGTRLHGGMLNPRTGF